MTKFVCEMCGGNDLIKQDGVFVCQHCGMKYSVEDAKKMMIEGTVNVEGTVKVDNSAFVIKYIENARRAYMKEDWEEVEKYYNMVEQNAPYNMEAVFFSAFGKTMLSLTDSDYHKRSQKFNVLINSISVISDYFELTNEDKAGVLWNICGAIYKMYSVNYVYNYQAHADCTGGPIWQKQLFDKTKNALLAELNQIAQKHNDSYIHEQIKYVSNINTNKPNSGGCYVATAVYGSYDCPEVWTLRRYRDYTLAETWYGRAFIRTYYAVSPTLVNWFGHTDWFKNMWKGKLDRMVSNLHKKGVESTPYEDKEW